MAPMNDQPQSTWRVDSQSPRIKADASNNLVEGYDVHFITGDGHSGTVFVPMARYTPDSVRAMVAEQAQLVDGVGALTSDG